MKKQFKSQGNTQPRRLAQCRKILSKVHGAIYLIVAVFLISSVNSCGSSNAASDRSPTRTEPEQTPGPYLVPKNDFESVIFAYLERSRSGNVEAIPEIVLNDAGQLPTPRRKDSDGEAPNLDGLAKLNREAITQKIPSLVEEGDFGFAELKVITVDKYKGKASVLLVSANDPELRMSLVFQVVRVSGKWLIKDVEFSDPS